MGDAGTQSTAPANTEPFLRPFEGCGQYPGTSQAGERASSGSTAVVCRRPVLACRLTCEQRTGLPVDRILSLVSARRGMPPRPFPWVLLPQNREHGVGGSGAEQDAPSCFSGVSLPRPPAGPQPTSAASFTCLSVRAAPLGIASGTLSPAPRQVLTLPRWHSGGTRRRAEGEGSGAGTSLVPLPLALCKVPCTSDLLSARVTQASRAPESSRGVSQGGFAQEGIASQENLLTSPPSLPRPGAKTPAFPSTSSA